MPDKKSSKKKIGEILLDGGHIDEIQLAVALGQQKEHGGKLGIQLLKLGFIAEHVLADVLKQQMGITWISLFDREIPADVLKSVPVDVALKYTVIPLATEDKAIVLAMTNPSDLKAVDEISFILGKRIEPVMSLDWEIERAILRNYQLSDTREHESLVKKHGLDRVGAWTSLQDYHGSKMLGKDGRLTSEADAKEKAPSRPAIQKAASEASKSGSMPDVPKSVVLEALINLLVRKGLMTKDDLLHEILRRERD